MLGIPIGGQKSGGITAGTHGVISVIKLGMLGIPVGGQQSGGGASPQAHVGLFLYPSWSNLALNLLAPDLFLFSLHQRGRSNLYTGGLLDGVLMKCLSRVSVFPSCQEMVFSPDTTTASLTLFE